MLLFIVLLLILAALCLYMRMRQMTILQRNGIPGPKPNLLYGNMFTHMAKRNVPQYSDYFAKYGKIMGYYMGKKPMILVNDIELIKQIQIKGFNNFADR